MSDEEYEDNNEEKCLLYQELSTKDRSIAATKSKQRKSNKRPKQDDDLTEYSSDNSTHATASTTREYARKKRTSAHDTKLQFISKTLHSIIDKDQVEDMVHTLQQLDGTDVSIVQDEMGVTSGIVLQTKVQKIMFKQWGETLTMDFAHGTSNLDYRLGSLIATTATGRGFSIIDFICRKQQATTISKILNFFKEKNPTWSDIATIVVDKDFIEWRVCEQAFPAAKILLCQCRAMTCWKEVLKHSVYRLTRIQHGEILSLLTKLLYSSTYHDYEASYNALRQYCKINQKRVFFAYFEEHWHSCCSMWSSFGRGKHFTAGNTTTKCVVATWNPSNMLTGGTLRISEMIAELLEHQITTTQQIVLEIEQHYTTSQEQETVPKFLRAIAGKLSVKILHKVKAEWKKCVTLMATATCERSLSCSVWKVTCLSDTFQCNNVEWTCTCSFNCETRLPCRHLMVVACKAHGFPILPANSIHERWNILSVLDVKGRLESAAHELQSIVRVFKVQLSEETLSDGSEEGKKTTASSNALKQVEEFQVVCRQEREDQVARSFTEKYSLAKTTFEPLLHHLSTLSSVDFNHELHAWKEMIATTLHGGKSNSATSEQAAAIEENDGDERLTTLTRAHASGTATMLQTLESKSTKSYDDQSSGDDSLPLTQQAEAHHERRRSDVALDSEVRSNTSNDDELRFTSTPSVRQADTITEPKLRSRWFTSKRPRQTKLGSMLDR